MVLLCTAVYDPQKALRSLLIPWFSGSLPKAGGMDVTLLPASDQGCLAGSCPGVWGSTEMWRLLRWLLNPSLGYKGKIGVGSKHGRTSICSSLGEVCSLGLSYAVASLVQTGEECGLLLIQFEHEWLGLQRRRRIWKPYYLCTEIEVSGIA